MFYGLALDSMGRSDEAIAEEKRAVELDPLSLIINRVLGATFYFARKYDEAIEQERKTLDLDANFIPAREYLALSYLQKSMYNEGTAEFEKTLVISPSNTRTLSELGYAYALAGRRAEAQKMLDRVAEISKHKYVPEEDIAGIYVGLAQKDKAFDWLEKGFGERSLISIKVDPVFDPLRSDPRFTDLLRRMNLQP